MLYVLRTTHKRSIGKHWCFIENMCSVLCKVHMFNRKTLVFYGSRFYAKHIYMFISRLDLKTLTHVLLSTCFTKCHNTCTIE